MNPEQSAVIELRQYTLHPGQREVLIELFEREFIDGQHAAGMAVIGQFRDLDDENRFVWLRGFTDMPSRAQSLAAFYDGALWRAHRNEANATMVDSDNVLLLRPARPGSGFAARPAKQSDGRAIAATIYPLADGAGEAFAAWFFGTHGATALAAFVIEPSANNFPRLPVREGENVFVSLSAMTGDAPPHPPAGLLSAPPQWLRLAPTARSWLR